MRIVFYLLSVLVCVLGLAQCLLSNPAGPIDAAAASEVGALWVIGVVFFVGAAVIGAVNSIRPKEPPPSTEPQKTWDEMSEDERTESLKRRKLIP